MMISVNSSLNQFDYGNKKLSAVSGTAPVPVVKPVVGNCLQFNDVGNLEIPGHKAALGSVYTLGCVIIKDTSTSFDMCLGTTDGANSGVTLAFGSSLAQPWNLTKSGVIVISSGLTLTADVPYFLAVSHNEISGETNFVQRRLDTGEVQTGAANDTNPSNDGAATWRFGGARDTFDLRGFLSAGFIVSEFFPTGYLLRWAQDPFGPFRMYDEAGIVYAVPSAGGGTGTGAQTTPAIVQDATGVMQPSGTAAQTTPSISQTATGVEIFTGTGAQTTPAVTQAATGLMQPEGQAVQTTPAIEQAGTGATAEHVGSAAQTTPSIGQSGSGVEVFTGAAAQTAPSVTQAATGTHTTAGATGTAAQTTPSVVQAGTGVEVFTGSGAQTTAAVQQAATGVLQPEGIAAQTAPSVTQAAAGAIAEHVGSATQTAPSIVQSAAGMEVFTGTAAQTIASILQAADGIEVAPGTAAQALAALTQSATGVVQPAGIAAQITPSVIQSGTGAQDTAALGLGLSISANAINRTTIDASAIRRTDVDGNATAH